MPLIKTLFKPGINRENTRYTTEGGWYDGDKIRFRQGNPETIGGWTKFTVNKFLGVCRSLWNWATSGYQNLIGIGTNLKFYIASGSVFYDITPIRATVTLGTNPFTGNGTTTVTVTATGHGASNKDFVTFSGATGTYAALLNKEFQLTYVDANTFTITVASAIPAGATGGSAVSAAYQISVGAAYQVAQIGWGASTWGSGTWGNTPTSTSTLRVWTQYNYGSDLVYGPQGGNIYYWSAVGGVSTRGVLLNSLGGTVTITLGSPAVITLSKTLSEGTAIQFSTTGALPSGIAAGTTYYLFNVNGVVCNLIDLTGTIINASGTQSGVHSISLLVDVPTRQNYLMVSDTSRFILAFGANDYGSVSADPMLVRWSDSDNPYVWTPDATNQAGSVRLSHGSQIVTAIQTRQEIVVFTDQAVYSMQYLGPPIVWGAQLLSDNISIQSPNAVGLASGVLYWMGVDKFYKYDGRVQTLDCDLRRYVFGDINQSKNQQFFCSTSEGFNEVWWFYCSSASSAIDRYVVFNYVENNWYFGTMARTAWLDSGLLPNPIATTYDATTETGLLLNQETGFNDESGDSPAPINAYISSSEFDIGDGNNFGYVWRVIPDITFGNSTVDASGNQPSVTLTLYPLLSSGSGTGPSAAASITKAATYTITEAFTGIVYTRVRGRQMILKIESNQLNTAWQLGAPRIDIRPDGRR